MEEGSRWKIGDGRSINVWTDSWLRDQFNRKVETTAPRGFEHLIVSDLFLPHTKHWNIDLVNSLFNHRDARAILSIPCNLGSSIDVRIWHCSDNGCYTIRSGYKLANEVLTSSEHLQLRGSWRKLWNCKIPPKVRVFAWRAYAIVCRIDLILLDVVSRLS